MENLLSGFVQVIKVPELISPLPLITKITSVRLCDRPGFYSKSRTLYEKYLAKKFQIGVADSAGTLGKYLGKNCTHIYFPGICPALLQGLPFFWNIFLKVFPCEATN